MTEKCLHAMVFGAGMAGLLTARVLSEFYESVTVVERDVVPDRPEHRKGVPQGRHLHNFLSRGTQLLGELLPGILDELGAAGAAVDDGDDLSRLYIRTFGYVLNPVGKIADPTLAAVRLRTKVAKVPGSRSAGIAMAFKLIEAAQDRWRAVNAPHPVALVLAGAVFHKGKLLERPTDITPAEPTDDTAVATGTEVA